MSLAAANKARLTPDALALADERTSLSWAQIDPILNRAANALLSEAAVTRMAIFSGNCVETVLAHLAGLHAGISTVPANFHFTADELAYVLSDSGARMLFVGPETFSVGLEAAERVGGVRVISWRSPAAHNVESWDDWLAQSSAEEPRSDMAPRPHLHYTSGTTGQPKAVETPPNMFPRTSTVRELFEDLKTQCEAMGDNWPSLTVSPLYHTGALSAVRRLAGGGAMVVMSRFNAEEVLKTIEQFAVKSTMMVPTHFQRLLALPEAVRLEYDVSSLKNVAHTGAACPTGVKRGMIEWFGPVLNEAYGATESGTTNMISSAEWLKKPGSVGKTLPPFEALVISESGEQLGPNEAGQLYFRDRTGRGIIYYNDAEKTRSAHLEPGVFTLGEIGYIDEEGYVFISDRVSDMIVSGGVNIYPVETEQVLVQHPGVSDVAIVGAPNAEMGEEVKALIVPREPLNPPTEQELDQFCRARLAGYKCPRSYEFVDDVGRNAMGKINKRALRRRFWPTERTIG